MIPLAGEVAVKSGKVVGAACEEATEEAMDANEFIEGIEGIEGIVEGIVEGIIEGIVEGIGVMEIFCLFGILRIISMF